MMLWYLNEYIVNDKLKFKIVRSYNSYRNWELIDTYVLYNGRFLSREDFRKVYVIPKQSMFKKLLAFFNKL